MSQNQTSSNGARSYNLVEIEHWLPVESALKVVPFPAMNQQPEITVNVMVLFVSRVNGELCAVLETEMDHKFQRNIRKTKIVSTMLRADENYQRAIAARIIQKTGLTPAKMEVCFCAKVGSTKKSDNIDHYKIGVIVTAAYGSLNTDPRGSGNLISNAYVPIKDLGRHIAEAQLPFLQKLSEKAFALFA